MHDAGGPWQSPWLSSGPLCARGVSVSDGSEKWLIIEEESLEELREVRAGNFWS